MSVHRQDFHKSESTKIPDSRHIKAQRSFSEILDEHFNILYQQELTRHKHEFEGNVTGLGERLIHEQMSSYASAQPNDANEEVGSTKSVPSISLSPAPSHRERCLSRSRSPPKSRKLSFNSKGGAEKETNLPRVSPTRSCRDTTQETYTGTGNTKHSLPTLPLTSSKQQFKDFSETEPGKKQELRCSPVKSSRLSICSAHSSKHSTVEALFNSPVKCFREKQALTESDSSQSKTIEKVMSSETNLCFNGKYDNVVSYMSLVSEDGKLENIPNALSLCDCKQMQTKEKEHKSKNEKKQTKRINQIEKAAGSTLKSKKLKPQHDSESVTNRTNRMSETNKQSIKCTGYELPEAIVDMEKEQVTVDSPDTIKSFKRKQKSVLNCSKIRQYPFGKSSGKSTADAAAIGKPKSESRNITNNEGNKEKENIQSMFVTEPLKARQSARKVISKSKTVQNAKTVLRLYSSVTEGTNRTSVENRPNMLVQFETNKKGIGLLISNEQTASVDEATNTGPDHGGKFMYNFKETTAISEKQCSEKDSQVHSSGSHISSVFDLEELIPLANMKSRTVSESNKPIWSSIRSSFEN